MKSLFLSLLLFFHFSVYGQTAPDTSGLQAFLDLDRFEAYSKAWAATMRGRGKTEIAEAMQRLSATDLAAMNLDATKLANAQNYDALILQVLKKKNPGMNVTSADVDWGYNFFKNKMNDGYLVSDVKPTKERAPSPMPLESRTSAALDAQPLESGDVLLDVDGYASDRTTRAVFWEASDSKRKIELFPGSASRFQDEMARRGAKVIAAVRTKARNYNPIYLIQNPGETGYHYAITEISGADRLKHFQLQISLVRWQKPGKPVAAPAPVAVVGNAAAVLAEEERALTNVLKTVPRADHVVIGQKGALERTFGGLGKIQSLMALNTTDPQALKGSLTEKELKVIIRAGDAGTDLPQFVMKYASDIDKLYQKAEPLLATHNLQMKPFTAFNYDRGTYEMSDYVLRGKDGKVQRWRVFSNVWGDEVLPIAKSLKASGYNSVNYIGTAGAFVGTDLKVGDLVIPKNAATLDGTLTEIPRNTTVNPDGAKSVNAVVNVQSPFEETRAWLTQAQRSSQVVEVETGYLASVFNSPTDNLNVQLLISDVVGSEHETLATAESSSRRKAQVSALSSILQDAGVVTTVPSPVTEQPLLRWVQELYPTRDPASQVQIVREAQAAGISTKSALDDFIKSEKSFTTAKLENTLRNADSRLGKFIAAIRSAHINPIISFTKKLFDGSYNPNRALEVSVAGSPEDQVKVKTIVSDFVAKDRDFNKFLEITTGVDAPVTFHPVGFANDKLPTITSTYKDGMLHYGGLGFTENSSGAMKFVRVSDVSTQPLTFPVLSQLTTSSKCSISNFGETLDDLLR